MRKFKTTGFSGVSLISLIMVLVFLFSSYDVYANHKIKDKDKNKTKTYLTKPQVDPFTTVLNINNITAYVQQNGQHPSQVASSWSSTFPKGTAGGIYQEGVVWGGLVNDGQSPLLRVGGNTYFNGTKDITRIFRVRPDYRTANLADDAANFFNYNDYPLNTSVTDGQIQEVYDQYEKDWMEWPADLGAPFNDVDENGVYDPNVDIPGIPGASQTMWIYYNDDTAPNAYGSPPIGLEVQETYWAYSIANPLGNVIFKRMVLVYVGTPNTPSNATIDDMYITQWSDPDVGQYTDDFAGCDPQLNLGYSYSSATTDAVYLGLGLAPPALGYDFFQGVSEFTGDPNDSAIVNLKWTKGYRYVLPPEQPMTTFVYFAAGGAWEDPDGQDPLGTPQWYNLMRGYLPRPPYPASDPFPRPPEFGGPVGGDSTYLLDGDPVTGEGWIDGIVEGPGDRRICCVHGPFNMALNDTVEVVLALLGGIGSSNTSSVAVLKFTDRFAQYAYDNLFDLPVFPTPAASITGLDRTALLNWGADLESYTALENSAPNGYNFEGYNVYQLPTSSFNRETAVKIATFDLVNEVTVILDDEFDTETGVILKVPVQVGKNSGIKRFLKVTQDVIRSEPLRNGSEYYFAITAYGYNPDETLPFNALESSPTVFTVVPQTPDPGVRYSGTAGDTVLTEHSGGSDGAVYPIIVDPSAVTGHNYSVTFQETADGITWTLTDETAGTEVLTEQTNQSGDDTYAITDGMMVKVQGPPLEGKEWDYASADPPNISPVATQTDPSYAGGRWFTGGNHGGELFFGGVFLEPNFWGLTSIKPGEHKPVMIKFRPMASYTDLTGNGAYDIGEPYVVDDPSQTQGAFMYQTFSGSAYEGFFDVPFTAWDISDPENHRQINVVVRDRDENQQWDLHNQVDPPDPLLPNGGDQRFNYTWFLNTDYDPTGTMYGDGTGGTIDFWSYEGGDGVWDAMWTIWVDDRHNGGMLAEESAFTLIPNGVNTPNDVFTFTAPTVLESSSLAVTDVEKINVFPNPYYGFHSREVTRDGKFVTFSHLPDQATIRIFDLAGVLVRTIEKNDPSQFIRWNLQNDDNYPVASGIYVVYIDIPELGTSKILKLAVIQEEQILRVY